MGGGDLNMKKSWHPLIRKNVERVWQEENRARDERKRIEQKRKEIAEERQLQDLQRLQESQGGKPRQERMDWMYASPSSGGQGTSESMEQYLLGKKTVDQLLKGDETEKLKRGTESGLIVTQNANSVVDTRNKILNDPLLAIKKQEQRQFEELMKNPLRLKQMRREMEKKTGSVKQEEVGDGHRAKKHRRHREDSREGSERRRERDDDYRSSKRRRSNDISRSDDISHRDDKYRQSRSTRNVNERSSHSEQRDNDHHRRHRSPPRSSFHRHSPPTKREQSSDRRNSDEERETALQAMLSNAQQLESSRAVRLAELETKDKEEQEREEIKRLQKTGLGQRAGFMRDFQGRILEEGKMAAVR
jgi:Pre-mRNA splicing factor/N-terminal domain of CBF1 interacting co-repressor CIR